MPVKILPSTDEIDPTLHNDPRWQLVERVIASSGFQRASQLRQILIYISHYAITRTDRESIRECEIACDVLGRRDDFDPASDNIVRVQISHLRRRLETYFSTEGANETLIMTIPKGSYIPVFEATPARTGSTTPTPLPDYAPLPETTAADTSEDAINSTISPAVESTRFLDARILFAISALFVFASAVFALITFYYRTGKPSSTTTKSDTSVFLQPLLRNGSDVSIILPDTSLLVIDTIMNRELTLSDYMKIFPNGELDNISDPKLRDALQILGSKRATTFEEAKVANDLADKLNYLGMHCKIHYARDLHVSDLSEGNAIILGSRKTNPWQELFFDHINYRFVQGSPFHSYFFENIHPRQGQATRYAMDISSKEQVVTYSDVAMTPNLTNSGYVLLISGEDVQGTAAAAQFLLNERPPDKIRSVLEHGNIRSFELFLRGTHIRGEANSHNEVIDFRYETR